MATIVSSYNPTSGAVDARTADSLSFSWVARPQSMTVYVRFQNLGTIQDTSGQKRVFQLTTAGTNVDSLRLVGTGTGLSAIYNANGSEVSSSVTPSVVAVGVIIEALVTLTAAGVVQLITSSNSAAVVTGTASSAKRLPATWGATPKLWVNSREAAGVAEGTAAFLNVLIVRGVQDMATMRRIAGVGPR